MELRQLRYFVAVAEELHFARAAARLLIATPSLSQQIKALERDLSVRLFDRSSTGVFLTPAGEQLLPLARHALAAEAEIVDAAQRIAAERATVLRLGFLPFALTATTRALLTGFGRAAGDVTVRMRQYEWDDPSGGLLAGETDAALVRPPFAGSDGLSSVVLAEEPVLAVMTGSHPLASADAVTRAQLVREPWLETSVVVDPVFAETWYLRGERDLAATTVRSEAATVEEWLAEIAFGRGVDLVPSGLAEEYRRPGLAFVPVADAPASSLVLAWRDGAPTEAVERLAAYAARWARRRRVGSAEVDQQ